ncbi:hypothetical protein PWKp5_00018 [Klebsiella phage PWKp5]|nr:hypothetical protein PWKp5_00018 [Klebsiella phage PWKp5]
MITPNITVYAFDEFSNFDSFVNKFGVGNVEAKKLYGSDRLSKSTQINATLDELVDALGESFRAKIYKKDGGLRKLKDKTVIHEADQFTVSMYFTFKPEYELFSNGEDSTHYVIAKGSNRPVFESGDIVAAMEEMERLNKA